MTKTSSAGTIRLRYETIRNLTSPEEKANGARSYFANMPIEELLKLDTVANLRDYIPDHPGKQRTLTHEAIGETLRQKQDRFIQLSGGITVSATDIEIDDNKKIIAVKKGSIINGAQTQGEIRMLLDELAEQGEEVPQFHARVEFMVDPDDEFVVETAIARNTSTNIQRVSMYGKKKYFDEMNARFQRTFPDKQLSKSETDTGEQFVDTQRVLQVLWAMMPEYLLPKSRRSTAEARLKSYKNRNYCLIDFEADVLTKDDTKKSPAERQEAQARYDYFVAMVGKVWREYLKWRHHEGWKGQYLKEHTRAVRRKDGSLTVADGVIFPILSAMSQFVVLSSKTGRWTLDIPTFFEDEEMIEAAREQLSGHDGNPMLMGRDAAVYETLALIPKMVLRLAKRVRPDA
jgi:hypothetical protein